MTYMYHRYICLWYGEKSGYKSYTSPRVTDVQLHKYNDGYTSTAYDICNVQVTFVTLQKYTGLQKYQICVTEMPDQ